MLDLAGFFDDRFSLLPIPQIIRAAASKELQHHRVLCAGMHGSKSSAQVPFMESINQGVITILKGTVVSRQQDCCLISRNCFLADQPLGQPIRGSVLLA